MKTHIKDLDNNIVKPLVTTAKELATPYKRAKRFSKKPRDLIEKQNNLLPPTSAPEKIEAIELNKNIKTK